MSSAAATTAPMFIGGQPVRPDRPTRDNISPATGEIVGRIPLGTSADVDAAVAAARHAAGTLASWSPFERADLCERVADAIAARADEIAHLLADEHGKPRGDATGEVGGTIVAFREAAQHARWRTDQATRAHDETKRVLISRRPHGVLGAISPWNFPLGVATMYYLAPGLAAGNALVWIPAPSTALVAAALTAAIHDTDGLPAGALNLVIGDGPVVGQATAAHPGVDAIGFTGSTTVGQQVALAAAGKPQLLELGGNGPTIVLADADLDAAAAAIAGSSFANAGQVCTSTGRVLADAQVASALATKIATHAQALVVGPPTDPAATTGPLHQKALADRVIGQIESAVAVGAKVIVGGGLVAGMPTDNFVAPTVVDEVPAGADLHVQETFGPVAPIVRFSDESEIRPLVDSSPFGLFAAIFSRDVARALRLAESLPTGTVNINEASNYWEIHLPAGGASGRRSGIGRAGGRWSLDELSQVQTITITLPPREEQAV